MPIITNEIDYNGFIEKVNRLGLQPEVAEVLSALKFELLVAEEIYANGTKGIRETIDQEFEMLPGWTIQKTGGIDWRKSNDRGATIGVEVQVSGRSDMLAVDIMHLKEDLTSGVIDVGIIIVPDNRLSRFLTDRTPNLRTAIKHIEDRARDLPIRVLAFGHDGIGSPLPKMRTNLGRLD